MDFTITINNEYSFEAHSVEVGPKEPEFITIGDADMQPRDIIITVIDLASKEVGRLFSSARNYDIVHAKISNGAVDLSAKFEVLGCTINTPIDDMHTIEFRLRRCSEMDVTTCENDQLFSS